MSQADLAAKIERPVQLIEDIEAGEGGGEDVVVAASIALALDSSLSYLFQGDKYAPTLKSVIKKHRRLQ